MIDIHTHILCGVDDGAQTLEDSLAMLKGLEENNVKAVFLTPHIAFNRGYTLSKEALYERFMLVKNAAKSMRLNIKLYFGSEIDYEKGFFETLKKAPTLNDSRFILLDLGSHKDDLDDIIYECTIREYNVIIAHPERYFQLSFDALKALKQSGAFFQVSAPHLLGFGHKDSQTKAKRLLKENMIDFIASDLHHPKSPLDIMERCYAYVLKKKGKETAEKLFTEHAQKYLIDQT